MIARARAARCGTAAILQSLADAAVAAVTTRDGAVAPADLRWAAARRAVVAAARARLLATGGAAEGQLFTASPAGATPGQRAALACAPAMDWPATAAPPLFAALGASYPDLLAGAARKRAGAWFTGRALAVPTAERTLAPLLCRGAAPRVCDPAAGSGAFLLAALEVLAATGRRRRAIAGEQLYGVDADPTAASLAAWALHEACAGDPPPIAAIEDHVHAGDGLAAPADAGFDAVLGNPPWETLQDERRELPAVGAADDRAGAARSLRARFHCQGAGKLYTYRLFVERAFELLRPGGRLGLIVPASLYFDRDAAPLRRLLLERCRWEWLFALENRRRLFPIDSRYRFGPIVAEKGGRTVAVRAAFAQRDPADWARPDPPHLLYRAVDVAVLSPRGRTFVELRHPRDLDLLRRLHANGRPLLGDGGACDWRQGDFNMTSDRRQFRRRGDCERAGYQCAADGVWRRDGVAPPLRALYQGAMVYDLHPNAGAHAGGTGRGVRWRRPAHALALEPQYLVAVDAAPRPAARIVLRALSNATNERTAVACLLGDEPCGNSLGVLTPRAPTATPVRDCAFVTGVLASLTWDWALRLRLGGTNLNRFVLADTVLPRADASMQTAIAHLVLRLCAILPWHARTWQLARAEGWLPPDWSSATHASHDDQERRQLRAALDVAVAQAFALEHTDLAWILRDCDHPAPRLRDLAFTRQLDGKGFWRVDRDLPVAARHPQLVLAAGVAAVNATPGESP